MCGAEGFRWKMEEVRMTEWDRMGREIDSVGGKALQIDKSQCESAEESCDG